MRTAILGWGSLIYAPGELQLVGGWHKDGPALPVEFARLSNNGTLTLVVTPAFGTTVTTYWAESIEHDLHLVRRSLGDRERADDIENIAAVTWHGEEFGRTRFGEVRDSIINWLRSNRNQSKIDAAAWTSLKPKGFETYTVEEIGAFIESDRADRNLIQEYIRRAPAQTITAVRRSLQDLPGWSPIAVAKDCFADGKPELSD